MSYYQPNEDEIRQRIDGLNEFNEWNRRVLMSIWSLLGKPSSYVDWGSGSGAMVHLARQCDVDAVGLDIIASPPDIRHDLRYPIDLQKKFYLATSIETVEHLPEDSVNIFCQSASKHLEDNGGWFVFTAALPGQKGHNHVNLKTPFFWREKLTEFGLTFHLEATTRLALLWNVTSGPLHHLPANLQVFVKGTP